jgi:hypothetical protein
VHLIDISPTALEQSERTLNRFEHVSVVGHRATYEEGLRRAAAHRTGRGTMFVLFLGSNIGNFDSPAAHDFLSEIRRALRPSDALLLGADLVKPQGELLLAYNDPLGVTAAFNKNLLARMNRELLSDFDLAAFEHRAVWNAAHSRVEMRPVSPRARRGLDPAGRHDGALRAGRVHLDRKLLQVLSRAGRGDGGRGRFPLPRAMDRVRRPLRPHPLPRRMTRRSV